jgi:hypothetical protein
MMPTPLPNDSQHPRSLPWVWLTLAFVMYALLSAVLTIHIEQLPLWSMRAVGILAGVWAWVRAWNWIQAGIFADALAVAWTTALAAALLAGLGFIAIVLVLGLIGAFAVALAREELIHSFSRIHTFVILFSASMAGLVTGWGVTVIGWVKFIIQCFRDPYC